MNNQIYATDLTDSHWEIIQKLIPKAKSGGRSRSLEMRQVISLAPLMFYRRERLIVSDG